MPIKLSIDVGVKATSVAVRLADMPDIIYCRIVMDSTGQLANAVVAITTRNRPRIERDSSASMIMNPSILTTIGYGRSRVE